MNGRTAGRPREFPERVRIAFYADAAEFERFREMVKAQRKKRSAVLRRLMLDWLKGGGK